MQVNLVENLLTEARQDKAQAVLNACVHCGFCTATCPTYLHTGNELDSPRGRIYLIKNMLETGEASEVTQTHLDRCLTCQSCETTCPSGVEYHALLAIGRETVDKLAPANRVRAASRWLIRKLMLNRPLVFGAFRIARALRALVPAALARTWLPRTRFDADWDYPARGDQGVEQEQVRPAFTRKVLVQSGCVQPALRPDTDRALAIVLAYFGVDVEFVTGAGCCGALNSHTGDEPAARAQALQNLSAWEALLAAQKEAEVLAIVSSASGCGAQLADYPNLLMDDAGAQARARTLCSLLRDPAELVWWLMEQSPQTALPDLTGENLSFHCPCTLQHALKLSGRVEQIFARMGVSLPAVEDSHLCCGSAGSYSLLQPAMARTLRDDKLDKLLASEPAQIITANVGCQLHLQGGTEKPVRHWLEILAEAMDG
ncbi:glycolate oxidase subunit GlcF [Simiduia sp. 21SJ11W-1]|uniref:glycolate oxidase subunit GlcF n=1 Tax=Simiduia sp. 21SJ11W-1 TaxID=2909669 RepID=UPI00209E0499|nr:glycolate oxidase subunit GlcF [Simiduia sp. 21SJ11W-1]UTA48413.1 glycolate oxidase subunit GlcF [Simiduia sp. 21SJ11W-1]